MTSQLLHMHHAAPLAPPPANCTHPPPIPLSAHPASNPLIHSKCRKFKGSEKFSDCWVCLACRRVDVVSVLRVSWLCLLLFLLSQPTWKPLPSLCPQFHRGQIDFDSVRTDRQTGTDSARRCDRTGTSLPLNQPLPSSFPPFFPPPYLPLTAINSPWADQCKDKALVCIFTPLWSPSIPPCAV